MTHDPIYLNNRLIQMLMERIVLLEDGNRSFEGEANELARERDAFKDRSSLLEGLLADIYPIVEQSGSKNADILERRLLDIKNIVHRSEDVVDE